ncbi:hypothetical protein L210DRAFT_926196 [Boletus edulis BED1]|uniref:Uncharacterized protein n=1 Tax=Boletus edulis BED1 TaxID=1328754 RepID=A0AAD4G7R4_BOLED|nr:hypothetical protein L210DRAFT_926196 [Boletus edulis BED1]
MPARKNSNVTRQASPEPPSCYRPLLQLDNSPSWIAEEPGPAHLGVPPDAPPYTQPPSHIQHDDELMTDEEEEEPPTKHEGRLLSVSPAPVVSPVPRSGPSALSLSPPVFYGHTRSPVLTR